MLTWNGSVLHCSCEAFRYQRRPVNTRTCKHTQLYFPEYAPLPDLFPRTYIEPPPFFTLREFDPERLPSEPLTEFYWSEKFDGCRILWDGPKGHMVTRTGRVVHLPTQGWTRDLPRDLTLDGELYHGPQGLHQVIAALNDGPTHSVWPQLRFMVFDSPEWPAETFAERHQRLLERQADHPDEPWELIEQHRVRSLEQLNQRLKAIARRGGEGLVLRHIDALYEKGQGQAYKWKLEDQDQGRLVSPISDDRWLVENSHGHRFTLRLDEHDLDTTLQPGQRLLFTHRGFCRDQAPKYPRFQHLL